jgi:endonuclease YncB( thermonuclease family)
MFHTLRRIVVVCGWISLAALALCLYRFRSALTPAIDLARSLGGGAGAKQGVEGELSGVAVTVFSGDSFQLQSLDGRHLAVRLTGIIAPDPRSPDPIERLRARQSRTNLSLLILSNRVRVTVTRSNAPTAVLGLVRAGSTQINAQMVRCGAAVVRRDLMNGLPLPDRYALIRAERRARAAALLETRAGKDE